MNSRLNLRETINVIELLVEGECATRECADLTGEELSDAACRINRLEDAVKSILPVLEMLADYHPNFIAEEAELADQALKWGGR